MGLDCYNLDIYEKHYEMKMSNNNRNKKILKYSNSEYLKELNDSKSTGTIPFEILPNIIEQQNNSVCKIMKEDGASATGFLCKIPYPDSLNLLPVLITCNHVLAINDISNNKEIELHFNNDKKIKKIIVDGKRKIYTNEKYDTTIIEIKKSDNFHIEKFLDIDNVNYIDDEDNNHLNDFIIDEKQTVYLIHYPNGLDAKLSFGTIRNLIFKENKLEHICTTYKGSSGCPIINSATQKVIGIHIGDSNIFKFKFATLLKGPIQDFNLLNKEKNEIIMTLKVEKEEINENIYFLDNTDYINKETNIKHFHNNLKELNIDNTYIYINENLNEYKKYFRPEKEGIYKIRIAFNEKFKDASYMFTNCTNIINIDFSLFKTDNITNMEYMFSGCSNLTSLDLTSFNTENVSNMRGMFGECSKVLNFNYSTDDFFPSKNSKVYDAVYYDGCENLKDIDLTSFNTNNVTDMSYMFCCCKNLINLKFSKNFNTKNVTNFYAIFGGCHNLEKLDLSSFNTEKANIMSGFFYQCYNLEEIIFSKFFNTSKVTNMSGMFGSCESLNISDLTFFNTGNVVCMSGMFIECYKIKNLNLSSFDTRNVVNMNGMFYGSYNLRKLNLNNFDTKNVENLDGIFDYCHPNLELLNKENNLNMLSEYDRKVSGNAYYCPLAGCNRRHHAKWYIPI